MKTFVKLIIPANAEGRGSANEYVVDTADPSHGRVVAEAITAAVDTRPDFEGRLAEFRRYLGISNKTAARSHPKPTGGRTPGARTRYIASSRMTDAKVVVEFRHFDKTGIAASPDDI